VLLQHAVILAAGRAIMACQGQTIALPCGERTVILLSHQPHPAFFLRT